MVYELVLGARRVDVPSLSLYGRTKKSKVNLLCACACMMNFIYMNVIYVYAWFVCVDVLFIQIDRCISYTYIVSSNVAAFPDKLLGGLPTSFSPIVKAVSLLTVFNSLDRPIDRPTTFILCRTNLYIYVYVCTCHLFVQSRHLNVSKQMTFLWKKNFLKAKSNDKNLL